MTWVKICGMTNLEDALVAVDAGADAVGFVFYEKSPRCVTVEAAREIAGKLPEKIEKVGVFVGGSVGSVLKASSDAGLSAVQVYPDEQNQFVGLSDDFLGACRAIVALPERIFSGAPPGYPIGFFPSDKTRERIYAVLMDSGTSERPGGTGRKFDWANVTWFRDVVERMGLRIIAAGGLTPQNVSEALQVLRPWGIDVSSGVEASPGKKDPEKVRAFVRAVREMDRKVG